MTGFDERLAREIVEAAIHRYLAAARERIAPFVDAHFSFPGTFDLPRRAIGWDLARAWLTGAGVDATFSAAHAEPNSCPWSLRQNDEDLFANRCVVSVT